jgi:ankyrin repeat protein
MSESNSVPSLPDRPHLNWLKNRAKERLDELRTNDPQAKLADAQLAVARQYGFASWRTLKEEVDARRAGSEPDEAQREALLKQFRATVIRGDITELRALLDLEPYVRRNINAPVFAFDGKAIISAKDPATVDLLLEYGADINARSQWWAGPWSALDHAEGHFADFLISRGAKVDVFAAAKLGKLNVLRSLLNADPELAHAKGGDGCRPLHFARSREAIDLLLQCGADINARDVDHGGTAAQWAIVRPATNNDEAVRASLDRLRYLLSLGADADVFMACAVDDVALLEKLLDANPSLIEMRVGSKNYPACPDAPGGHIYVHTLTKGVTPVQVVAEFRSNACAKFLVSHGTPKQRFLAACSLGDEQVVRAMRAHNPDLVRQLSREDQYALPGAAWSDNLQAVRLMLDQGFDPLTPGADSGTALHCAAWRGNAPIVKVVLEHPAVQRLGNAAINAVEPTHHSRPLGWCFHGSINCRDPRGNYPEVARLLLAAGAIPEDLAGANEEIRSALGERKT